MSARRSIALAVAVALGLAGTARAERPASAAVRTSAKPPQVSVALLLEPGPHAAGDVRLRTRGPGGVIDVTAAATRPYGGEDGRATALALVVQMNEAMLGAGGCTEPGPGADADELARRSAVERSARAIVGNRAWQRVALVTFGVDVIAGDWVAGDAGGAVAAAIGRRAFCDQRGGNVKKAVDRGAELLARAAAERRVLVVIADQPQVDAARVRELRAAGIEAYWLLVKGGSGLAGPGSDVFPAGTFANLDTDAAQLRRNVESAWWFDFPGKTLPFDGRHHTLEVHVKGADEPVWLADELLPAVAVDRSRSIVGAVVIGIAIVLGLVVIVALALRWRGRRAKRRTAPGTAVAPATPRPATLAAAPQKTEALSIRPTTLQRVYDGPKGVAGWVVPLDGPSAYRTFVLDRAGDTLIGRVAGDGVGVVLDDAKISKVHCKIVGRSGYFAIVDLESDNGVWVDGERVTEKTLRSGMRIKLGGTTLVFKCVDPTAVAALV